MIPEARQLVERARARRRFDIAAVGAFGLAVLLLSQYLDFHERLSGFLTQIERWEGDEVLVALAAMSFALSYFAMRRWREASALNEVLQAANTRLLEAASEIKTLRGIVPICASCKRIRDDAGFWHQVESYVTAHTLAEFSHGLCPGCAERAYAELFTPGIDSALP